MKTLILFTFFFLFSFGYLGCSSSSSTSSDSEIPQDTASNKEDLKDSSSESDSMPLLQIDLTNILLTRTSASCENYVNKYHANVKDVKRDFNFESSVQIAVVMDKCVITSNAIPNHNFNDGERNFATLVSKQNQVYQIPKVAIVADSITQLTLQYDDAVFLNGVKLDILSAGCYNVGNGKIGCGDITTPWRLDPAFPQGTFGTDSHNAHTQSNGAYHYHASPKALFSSTDSSKASPVIGFAADGFPIYGTFFDDNGTIRKAKSSYRLRTGNRVDIKNVNPGGTYDGTYRDDYEYIMGSGDLDECNGMIQNDKYGYYITESYPWVLGCFKGTPDPSFSKKK